MAINGIDYQELGKAADALCEAIKERHKMDKELGRETELRLRHAQEAAITFASKCLGSRLHMRYDKNRVPEIDDVDEDSEYYVKCYVNTRNAILKQLGIETHAS